MAAEFTTSLTIGNPDKYSSRVNDLTMTEPVTCPMWVLLLQAAQRVEARYEAALGEQGLSIPKLAALKHLVGADEPMPLGRLAERLACVKSNITQLVDRLESDGLVARIADSADRRCVRASITEEGRRRLEAGAAAVAGLEREIFGAMEAADRDRILAFLTAVATPCGS
jgi:DNA-binding MarR family transcriptional regulator